jgi:tetratricopeptide (TPR) repeat protein
MANGAIHACGPWLPPRLLENGGSAIRRSPEFFFELEMKQLAAARPVEFRFVAPAGEIGQRGDADPQAAQTAAADLNDLANRLASRGIVGEEAKRISAQHEARRGILQTLAKGASIPDLGEGEDEFALYHRGAAAYRCGSLDEAVAGWKRIVELPGPEMHFRSTWAAFMMGRALLKNDPHAARAWLRWTRDLAREGFHDSLGLASASYGWEGRIALDLGEFEEAARLYLEQLATGDVTAVNSLKAVVGSPGGKVEYARAAADPLLRRITTAYLLSVHTPRDVEAEPLQALEGRDLGDWLSAVESRGDGETEDSDRLGWIAYSGGDFAAARRWLARTKGESLLGCWLRAKLEFRDGRLESAKAAMARAVRMLPSTESLLEISHPGPETILPEAAARGDAAMLHLSRREFTTALRLFLAGDHWEDAAYIAERVLTPDELVRFVSKEARRADTFDNASGESTVTAAWPDPYELRDSIKSAESGNRDQTIRGALRWLTARRLMRNRRYREAQEWFPEPLRPLASRYAAALDQGADSDLPKRRRAMALWKAAVIARRYGMELMGTEVEPDSFTYRGAFPVSAVSSERRDGFWRTNPWDQSPASWEPKPLPLVLPSSASERERLKRSELKHEQRFQYRYVAADLAWRAAALLPDGDQETARVLWNAGLWLKNRDPGAADRFLQAIENRCPLTEIGKAALELHWFPPGSQLGLEDEAARSGE